MSSGMTLADLLIDRGELDELRAQADRNDAIAAGWQAELLTDQGETEQFQITHLDLNFRNIFLTTVSAGMLADRGKLDELRAWADAGNMLAAVFLLNFLAAVGDKEVLENEIYAGHSLGINRLADIWCHGDNDVTDFNLRLCRLGLDPEGSITDRCS
jgi:hypothetical protein